MSAFIQGALMVAAFVAALFFFHYYRLAKDRFFALFGVAFALLGLQWMLSGVLELSEHERPFVYLLRLAGFLVILLAIIDKNRDRR